MFKYYENLKWNNLDNIIILEYTFEENNQCFRHIFIYFNITISEFQYYQLILELDDIHFISKYKNILFIIIVININEFLFSLIYIIVNNKNDDNWLWFNHLLRIVITKYAFSFLYSQVLIFVFNHQKDFLEILKIMFS